jgi:hypothetical protein
MNTPFRLNLEQQKKRAKELLKGFTSSDESSIRRFAHSHPKLIHKEQSLTDFVPKLADAQLVIARELNCKTWNQLRNHIAVMDAHRNDLETVKTLSDEPNNCLHIRCGSDIAQTLKEAGFKGEFLEFSDPFCVGPVTYEYDAELRARFLSESYGKEIGRDYDKILSGLIEAYNALSKCATNFEDVVLWFEHDPYDQFILIFLLSYFHRFGLPKRLWLVTINEFPGAVRFQGLGQLPPEALRLLWQLKQPVSVSQCEEANKHWQAYTSSDPKVFHEYVHGMTDTALPYFKNAALRQLKEQPLSDGQLPMTQALTVELLKTEGPQKAGALFRKIMEKKEPLPFLGDVMYWHILRQMKEREVVQFAEESDRWPDTLVDIV